MTQAQWRHMDAADIDGVTAVARIAFPDHFEDRACFAERFTLYPRGCFALIDGDGAVTGYLIAYPWLLGSVPPLDTLIGTLPPAADCIYLHDLALHPASRDLGHTRPIVDTLIAQARADGWKRMALVAVNNAVRFWEGQGFTVQDDPALALKLASYGLDARYMDREI